MANLKIEPRTARDYRSAIKELLSDAEVVVKSTLEVADDDVERPTMSKKEVEHYLKGLDIVITEEAMIALRAEFLRYSSIFDTKKSQTAIRMAIAEVTKPLIEAWINRYLSEIAREVVTQAIGKIADVGRSK